MSLGVILLFQIIVQTTASYIEIQRRKRFVTKWAKGELTIKELLWLKRQPWFQKAFQQVSVEPDKKTN